MFHHRTIGIWGYGKTGAAAVNYFREHHAHAVHLYDSKPLPIATIHDLTSHGIKIYSPDELALFLCQSELILKSPGVPLDPRYSGHQFIIEFDLMRREWQGPIIAITGTVGKTTVTSLLTQLIAASGMPVVAGGNIGRPLLELLCTTRTTHTSTSSTTAVVELSSFQLEQGITAGPDLAIITNIHHNHLDRHGTMSAYLDAKLNLIMPQTADQRALLPLALAPIVRNRMGIQRALAWFSTSLHASLLLHLCPTDTVYYTDNTTIMRLHAGATTIIGRIHNTTSFVENILIIAAALDQCAITVPAPAWKSLVMPPHRLAPIAAINNITFYNDSKATIPAATLAALEQLHAHPLILFIGGVSKGIDRQEFVATIARYTERVICFGTEARELATWCRAANITATCHVTLEEGFAACIEIARSGDHVLFSPAGASFDLFPNYEVRGERFIDLVNAFNNAFNKAQP